MCLNGCMPQLKQRPLGRAARPIQSRQPVRTFCAALCGLFALLLLFASIILIWLNQTLDSNRLFVRALSPLSAQTDVQNFVIEKATDTLLQKSSAHDVAALLPGQPNAVTSEQLQTVLRPVIESNVRHVVRSPQFGTLWKNSLQSVQRQVLAQLNGGSPTVTVDLHPTLQGIISLLHAANVPLMPTTMALPPGADSIVLHGTVLQHVRRFYRDFRTGSVAVVLLALAASGLCAALSVHHIRTIRRVLVGFGLINFMIAVAIYAATSADWIHISSDPLAEKAVIAAVRTLLHTLQLGCLALGAGSLIMAVGSKIIAKWHEPRLARP